MLARYWQKIGGALAEEFYAVRKTTTASPRRLDGLIVENGPNTVVPPAEIDVEARAIIVVQLDGELRRRPAEQRSRLATGGRALLLDGRWQPRGRGPLLAAQMMIHAPDRITPAVR
jgi:hypothetical protein